LGRLHRYDLQRQTLEPITEEGVGRILCRVSPDGRFVIANDASGVFHIYPVEGGAPRALEGIEPGERPIQWDPDGSGVFVFERGRIPSRVHRMDLATGRRDLCFEITPRNVSGVDGINSVCLTPDGRSYATSYTQGLSELYLARGSS
jgi:Tol biopolymer transport system component